MTLPPSLWWTATCGRESLLHSGSFAHKMKRRLCDIGKERAVARQLGGSCFNVKNQESAFVEQVSQSRNPRFLARIHLTGLIPNCWI